MKIMVVMGEYPPEEAERRRQAVLKCASQGTEIGFSVVKATFFRRSNSEANALATGPLVAEAAQKAEAERRIVVAALARTGWHVGRAAAELGLADHSSLLKIMRRHGVVRPDT